MGRPEKDPIPEAPFRQAVLYCSRPASALGPIADHTPAFLIALAGKCLADRIIGRLGDLGVKSATLLVTDDADRAMAFLGDGTRWGIDLRIVDVRTPGQLVDRLKALDIDEPFLLGDLHRFPGLKDDDLATMAELGCTTILDPAQVPTGWAVLTPAVLKAASASTLSALMEQVAAESAPFVSEGHLLDCRSASGILESTRALLEQRVPHQIVPGASGEPRLWIGAGSIIHPTVEIIPPVWIGENCRIDKQVRLGPCACIADECVLGHDSQIEDACVLQGTSIGHELELNRIIADRNYLASVDSGQTVAIPDPFLIGPNQHLCPVCAIGSLFGRVMALLLFIPVLPLLAGYLLMGLVAVRRPVESVECIRLPASSDPMLWKTFRPRRWAAGGVKLWWERLRAGCLARLVLGLPEFAFGRLHWVGLAPRTKDETDALSEDWRMLYLGSKPGLFQLAETDRRRIGDSSIEQQFSSEAYYASFQRPLLDLQILLKCLFAPPARPAASSESRILSLTTGNSTLDHLHDFLNRELASKRIPKQRRESIITAVHEATTNIIKHGYDQANEQPIQLHLHDCDGAIEISLYDRGRLFDPESIVAPDLSINADGGFGWYLINSIADDVYFTRANEWNHLSLVFNHNAKGEAEHENQHIS